MIPDDEGSPRPLALPLPRADDGFDAKAAAAATGFSSFSLCTKEEKVREENEPRDKYRIFPDYGFSLAIKQSVVWYLGVWRGKGILWRLLI